MVNIVDHPCVPGFNNSLDDGDCIKWRTHCDALAAIWMLLNYQSKKHIQISKTILPYCTLCKYEVQAWCQNKISDIKLLERELRDAERVYVNGILQNGLESGNNKSFWKYVPKTRNFWYLCS